MPRKIQLVHPRKLGDGKTFKEYAKGVHEVSEDVYNHWFTQKEMEAGNITMPFAGPAGSEAKERERLTKQLSEFKDLAEKQASEIEKLKLENDGLKDELKAAQELLDSDEDEVKEESKGKGKKSA